MSVEFNPQAGGAYPLGQKIFGADSVSKCAGAVHTEFETINIHTAKCDLCNRHNTSEIFRCTKRGRHCCKPSWDSKGGSGRHTVHDQGRLAYTGPKAEPLPPILSDRGKKVKVEDRIDSIKKD
ncbi:MAG: hypothetical protein Q9176_000411 [Flavoplaca citrina]